MNDHPYTAHDATSENGSIPVWNVKGPGNFDRLISGGAWEGKATERRAAAYVADLNEAFAAGRKSMEIPK